MAYNSASPDQKAGYTGAFETLERIHRLLQEASLYRYLESWVIYFHELEGIYMEVAPFLKRVEINTVRKLIREGSVFKRNYKRSPKTTNQQQMSKKFKTLELYLRTKLHKYNLLMPRLSDTKHSMLG